MKPVFSSSIAHLLPALIVCSFTCGCGLMFAEIEEPKLCETTAVEIPAATAARSSRTVVTDLNLPSEVNALKDLGFTSDFKFSIQFEAKEGVRDFNFIDSATAHIAGDEGWCPIGEVVRFERASSAPAEASLIMPSGDSVDLVTCLGRGNLKVETTFAGNLPTTAWSMDVKVCLSGKARIDVNGK